MNNKIKSLIYLSCFLLSAMVYHITETPTEIGAHNTSEKELVKVETHKSSYSETNEHTLTY
ncbi:hypothetical protein [Maribacter sp. 2307ULW6-5]|uniref:hypothetical protein n=1 Tax=Maribacter sp. 2307ULW6-5 TaxID=3386275 RepID=UPI0039BCD3A5